MDWQPISTAPKWWTPVILHDPEAEPSVFEGYFAGEDNDREAGWHESGNSKLRFNPTHWLPLPPPPENVNGPALSEQEG